MRHLPRSRRSRPPYRVDSVRPARHTGRVPVRDLERLATFLKDRRAELGVTQEEFVLRAGQLDNGRPSLSLKQLQRIEKAQVDSPRPKTLGALDRAADWPAGTCRLILEGHEVDLTGRSVMDRAVAEFVSLDGTDLLAAAERWMKSLDRTQYEQALATAQQIRAEGDQSHTDSRGVS